MKFLLDTHIFLWIAADDRGIRARIERALRDATEVYVSTATIWEIAIKSSLGKLRVDPEDAIEEIRSGGFRELPILSRHAAAVSRLPFHHRDPFDRLLVAQAMSEPMRLLTADARLGVYSELVVIC